MNSRNRAECLDAVVLPPLQRGDEVSTGRYWRLIETAKHRYHDDGQTPPEWGHKFDPRPDRWTWMTADDDGLSVSAINCCSGECAAQFHPSGKNFSHVVCIDLEALASELKMAVQAQYDPVELSNPSHPEHNACHFVLLPASDRLEDFFVELKRITLTDWPNKLPRDDANRAKALRCKKRWESIFSNLTTL